VLLFFISDFSQLKKKPTRSLGKNPLPDMPGKAKTRVIKLSLTNIISLIGAVVLLLVLFNFLTQPPLGQEVTIDSFLNNVRDNKYAAVDIRNDGNASAKGKYVNFVELGGSQNLQISDKNKNIYQSEANLEKKSLQDLLGKLKTPANINDALSATLASFRGETIKEIYVLENKLIVDWEASAAKDWVIENTTETSFISALNANNTDVATLKPQVTYLRSAATLETFDKIQESLSNGRYRAVWQVEDRLYAVVKDENILMNYVNFGTATPDFTKFLQDENITLGSDNVVYRVLPINKIDIVTLVNLAFIAALGVLGYMLLKSVNSSNSGLMQFGKSKARMFFGQKVGVTFKDVAGVEEAKEELKEVVEFLRTPDKYTKLGAKIPRGVLMVGEPGTGKTLLARAVAGEAGVPFFHTSGSEFEEMLVGAGASRVRDLFDKAKKASPSLIFIDEIDAVGRKRGTTMQSSSTEQTLNQILVEMDGFEARENVIIIAATNRPDVLDPALLRPGRFDRKVVLDSPDIVGRTAILKIHSANKPLAAEVNLEKVAKRTVGFSGADLANMLNEAAIIVAKDNRNEITVKDIEEAATKVQTGPIRRRNRSFDELKMTAYHEAAHAVVMFHTPQSDPVHRITILSRGMALGYTMPLPETDQLQMTKTMMESKIRSLLAGWSAEEMFFKDVTTGASNDIERATNIAQRMIKQFGMSKKLGLIKYGNSEDEPHMGWGYSEKAYSEATAEIIDLEVRRIIQEAYEDVKIILSDKKEKLIEVAELLLKQEVVEAEEFKDIMTEVKAEPKAE